MSKKAMTRRAGVRDSKRAYRVHAILAARMGNYAARCKGVTYVGVATARHPKTAENRQMDERDLDNKDEVGDRGSDAELESEWLSGEGDDANVHHATDQPMEMRQEAHAESGECEPHASTEQAVDIRHAQP